MDKTTKSLEFREVLLTFLTVVIAVIAVFGIQILLQIQSSLADLRSGVVSAQSQSVSQRNIEPFRILDENCTRCHSDRKFTQAHSDSELTAIIHRMDALPDLEISAKDQDAIHGALKTLKCVRCHEDTVLKRVLGMNSERQREIVERMRRKPGSDITREEASEILRTMQQIQGY